MAYKPEIGMNVTAADINVFIVPATIIFMMTPIGLIGNGLVLASVFLSAKLRTKTNVFIVSLALTDLLNCVFFPVQALSLLSENGSNLGLQHLCATSAAIVIFTVIASINNMALIAVNRWIKITRSSTTYSRIYSRRNMFFMILVSWTIPVCIFTVPQLTGTGQLGYSSSFKVCLWKDDTVSYEYMITTMAVPSFIAAVTFLGTYIDIGLFIWKRKHRLQQSRAKEIMVTKTVGIIVCMFFLCIVAFAICVTIRLDPIPLTFSSVLVLASSIVNPFVYAFKQSIFRQTFLCVIKCHFGDVPDPSRELRNLLRRR
ncbi:melatonin receptor type 1C-like [Lytechinus variegatus]|uniref:melatonin receptor type 1C-like n=1 Tax=Lytechinus variegatus TaxID=7654 RepID=UPI001BB120E9|nr:melatonin receptor type 1C-like [Lytechinus variegatus]